MDKNNSNSSTDDKCKVCVITGYVVTLKYTEGKTFYQCMESAVKRMNDKLKYKII